MTTPTSLRFASLFSLACMAVAPPISLAATTVTYIPGDVDATDYDTTGNDLTLSVPAGSATQSGVISGTGNVSKIDPGTLTLSNTNTHAGVTTVNGGTLVVDGASAAITSTSSTDIGVDSAATLTVSNAAQVSSGPTVLGYHAGGAGTLNVDGTGSQLHSSDYIDVGSTGSGSMNITGGGSVSSDSFVRFGVFNSGVGSALVSGAGSQLNAVAQVELGTYGQGVLTIADGGTVSAQALYFNRLGSGNGTLNLNSGGTLVITSTNGIANYGAANTASLNLAGGTLTTNASWNTFLGATLSNITTIDTNGYNIGIYAPLSGTGGFIKAGTGVLTVTNNNTFSGPVTVSAGTLVVNTASDLGTGNGNVTVSAGAALAAATNLEFSRNVTVTGTDAIVVSPNNLEVGSAGNGQLTIANGGIVASGTTTTLGYYGSGTGTVDVSGVDSILYAQGDLHVGYGGTGTLTLENGGTANAQNLILASQSGSAGTINLNGGGVLQVGGTGGVTVGSGTGTFNLAGGTLRVGGDTRSVTPPPSSAFDLNNLATQSLAIINANASQAGSTGLTTDVAMTLSNASTIDTNGSAATLSGVLSGSGALVKAGDGVLMLTNINTYTGSTTVQNGELVITGSMGSSAVTVQSGARLGGNGAVGGLTNASGGTVSPGNSIGILTVSGDYSQGPSGTLAIEVTPDTTPGVGYDQLQVGGTASLDGALQVQVDAGSYTVGTVYNIVHAVSAVTGTFASTAYNPAFAAYITPEVSYGANDVYLTLAPTPGAFTSGNAVLQQLFSVNQLTTQAFDVLQPNAGDDSAKPLTGVWLQGFGGTGKVSGFDTSDGGALLGVGGQVGDDLVIGGALSSASTRTNDGVGLVKGQTWGGYGYGLYTPGNWRLMAAVGAGQLDTDSTRSLAAVNMVANGSSKGSFTGVSLNGSYRIDVQHAFVEPYAGASALRSQVDGYRETGAGMLNLTFGNEAQNLTVLEAGARLGTQLKLSDATVVPWLRLGGTSYLGDRNVGNAERLGTVDFSQSLETVRRTAFDAGAGVQVGGQGPWNASLAWDGQYADKVRFDRVKVVVQYQW